MCILTQSRSDFLRVDRHFDAGCLLLLLTFTCHAPCHAAPPVPSSNQPPRNILIDLTAKPELLSELERSERKAGLAIPAHP